MTKDDKRGKKRKGDEKEYPNINKTERATQERREIIFLFKKSTASQIGRARRLPLGQPRFWEVRTREVSPNE